LEIIPEHESNLTLEERHAAKENDIHPCPGLVPVLDDPPRNGPADLSDVQHGVARYQPNDAEYPRHDADRQDRNL
jgi:hypothetical protein